MMSNVENNSIGQNELLHVSAREAIRLLGIGAILVDVRPKYELGRLFNVERVIYCNFKEMPEQLSELPKDDVLVIADAVGLRSKEVAVLLMERGFKKIYNLAGGIVDWERAGFPVTTDKSRILTGSCMCQLKTRNKKTY